jgi:bacterial/archaeal transporter family-2 protein
VSRPLALILTLAVGLLIGIQPAANGALSKHVGALGAAFVSLAISLVIVAVLLLSVGHPSRLSGIGQIRPEHLLGGIGGAAIVAVGILAVRPLGAGAVIALLVSGQIVISVVADRFGWFGVHHVSIGIGRSLGVLLVIAGTVLVTRS